MNKRKGLRLIHIQGVSIFFFFLEVQVIKLNLYRFVKKGNCSHSVDSQRLVSPSSGLAWVSLVFCDMRLRVTGARTDISAVTATLSQAGHGIVGRQLSVIVTRESVGKHLWYPRQPAASPDSFHHINQPQLGLPSVPALMPGLSPCRPL